MALKHYDRSGAEIDWDTWVRMANDVEYKAIRITQVTSAADPHQSWTVSTTWMGIDLMVCPVHAPSGIRVPLIFETAVFDILMGLDTNLMFRYPTLEAAHAGHQRTVTMVAEPLNEAMVSDVWGST